jgi:hypothetical protein
MKKYCLLAAVVFLLPVYIHGQEEAQFVSTRSALEWNRSQSLWFHSANAAGLAFQPLRNYNIVSAAYSHASGGYKQQQEGDKTRSIAFNTNGALQLGKAALWGDFSFSDDFVTGSTYNTNRYDPAHDMPYFIADANKSDWKKQYYDMGLKASVPLCNRFALGVHVRYTSQQAAKQLDPRSVVSGYAVSVAPSLLWQLTDRHNIGVSGLYRNSFDRNTFTNSLSRDDQRVYIMKGLGNYATGVVGGSNGLQPFYYPGNRYGGGVQYGYTGDHSSLLIDLNYAGEKIDVFETPTKPRRRGTTNKRTMDETLQWLHTKGALSHKIAIGWHQANTDGTEYIQEYNSAYEINQWITLAEYIKSSYSFQKLSLRYDLYKGTDKDYAWRAGINAQYTSLQDEYIAPNAVFGARNAYAELSAKKNLPLGASNFLVGMNLGYNRNIDGAYVYTGDNRESLLVTDFYAKDIACLSADYLQAGARVDWSLPIKGKSAVNVGVDWQWTKPATAEAGDRTFIGADLAYIF